MSVGCQSVEVEVYILRVDVSRLSICRSRSVNSRNGCQ